LSDFKKMSKPPKYKEIIAEGILKLNEKGGSSSIAIIKYAHACFGKDIHEKRLKTQLKKMVKDGHLVQVKNSFKLADPKAYHTKKSFVKKGGLSTRPKKILSGKKITGAADIMKKLNENKQDMKLKSPAKKESTRKESAKKSDVKKSSTRQASVRKSSAKKASAIKKT